MADVKMTDERIAAALGWKPQYSINKYRSKGQPKRVCRWLKDGKTAWSYEDIPAFTTSLDAIVAEIEARGEECKDWCICWLNACSFGAAWDAKLCCAALLAYLKENKR